MNRHTIIRISLPALLLAVFAAPVFSQASTEAVVLRGTVSEVPIPVEGILDWSSPDAMHFRWDSNEYSISSNAILNYEWTKRSSGAGQGFSDAAGKVERTILPFRGSDKKYLTIDFKTEDGRRRYLVFGISREMAPDADRVLHAWIRPTAREERAEATWWGNRYWKTKRSAEAWEKRKQQQEKIRKSREAAVEVAARDEE